MKSQTFRFTSAILIVLLASVLFNPPATATATEEQSKSGDSRDGKVLESLLLKLLDDPEFSFAARNDSNRTNIILSAFGPEKFGIAGKTQVENDIGRKLPTEEFLDMELRNRIPKTFDTLRASYKNLKLSDRIQIIDIADNKRSPDFNFARECPTVRAWVQPYLPGYSKDGQTAFVRGWVGPSAHGATVTALLRRENDQWKVVWHKLARYL